MSKIIDGKEILDPTPLVQKTNLRMPSNNSTLRMRQMIRQELSQKASEAQQETFEEADDFELDNEEWISPYENGFEPELPSESEKSQETPLASSEGVTGEGLPPVAVKPQLEAESLEVKTENLEVNNAA